MIRIESLARSYGALEAVRGIDLDIPQGEFFAFLGPNAAGKTTTIKMLAGLLTPTAGRAIVGGFDIQTQAAEAKKIIAYVPDFPFLYDKLTPVEFMRFVGELFLMERDSIREKTEALFDQFHLNEHRDQLIENLSHGTRQRVVISSALLHDPQVIIIDEPMVGLDPRHAAIVKAELKKRSAAGTTIFLSTHQLSVAEEVADRVAIINHGKVIALGTVEELKGLSSEKGALEKVFLDLVGEDG